MRSTPASSSATTSSPSREKSAGRTDGAISIGRAIEEGTYPAVASAPVTTLLLRPDRFVAGGDAIARDDSGRVVFVRGAVPGETVEAEVLTAKKDWARAITVAVIDPSPSRVTPPCASRRAGCGGCGWQHLTLEAQRAARVEIVIDALRRTGGVAAPVVEHGGARAGGAGTGPRCASPPMPTAWSASVPRARTRSSPRRPVSSPTRVSPRCSRSCASIKGSS